MKIVQRSYDIWAGEEGLEEVRAEKAKKKKRSNKSNIKFDKKVKGELYCYDKKLSFLRGYIIIMKSWIIG